MAENSMRDAILSVVEAKGGSAEKIAGMGAISFTRSGNTITATTTGGNPGYYLTAYDF